MSGDIIDRIDELVDEQMAEGEPLTGFSYGDPTYPKCPHCNRHWHGLRLTQKIASMYSSGNYDPDYGTATDDSPIVCEGSEFIGPQRQPENDGWGYTWPSWTIITGGAVGVNEAIRWTIEYANSQLAALSGFSFDFGIGPGQGWEANWSLLGSLRDGPRIVTFNALWEPIEPTCETDVLVTFGPENWVLKREPERMTPWGLLRNVGALWNEMSDNIILVPASPGYDFSEYDTFITEERGPQRPRLDRVVAV